MRRRFWSAVIPFLAAMVVVGVAIAYLADRRSDVADDFWSTVSKGGVAFALTAIAAAFAAIALRVIDFRRARDDDLRRLHRAVVDAYNSVKAVRRRLVALGLDRLVADLSDDRWAEMKAALDELNSAQLSLEAIKREVDLLDAFAGRAEVSATLALVEKYLNEEVLELWEAYGWKDWKEPASPRRRRRAAARRYEIDLSRFVEKKYFRHNVSDRLDLITDVLRKELGRR